MRYFWLWNAKNLTNFALFQVVLFQNTDYLNPYFTPHKKFICILQTEVSEYVATAFFKNRFFCHGSLLVWYSTHLRFASTTHENRHHFLQPVSGISQLLL